MSDSSTHNWISRTTETRPVRLTGDSASLESAEAVYLAMKHDRPHMAARLSKLMPKQADDERSWSGDVMKDRVHVWVLKALRGSVSEIVAVMWFELVGTCVANVIGDRKEVSNHKGPTTAHIEVLWTYPQYRQIGFGTRLVQSVLVRYPNISRWTAFTSRDMKKDAGVNRFWIKNGFYQESIEVGRVNQDGFFIRNSELEVSRRRRVQPAIFEIIGEAMRKRKLDSALSG